MLRVCREVEIGEGWIGRDGGCVCIYLFILLCCACASSQTFTATRKDDTQEFRMIQANFESGPARTMSIDVKPRGPRGFSGSYTHTHRQTHRHTDTQTHRHTHTNTHKQREREREIMCVREIKGKAERVT